MNSLYYKKLAGFVSREAEPPERGGHVKVCRCLQRRLPGAEFVSVRGAAIDAEEVGAPLVSAPRHGAERSEGQPDDDPPPPPSPPQRGKEAAADPGQVSGHRGPDAVRRVDAGVKGRTERIDLDLEVGREAARREKDFDDVFLPER